MDEARAAPDRPRRAFRLRRPTLKEALIASGAFAAVSLLILVLVLRGLPGDGRRAPEPEVAPAPSDRVPASPRGEYRVTGRVQLDDLPNEFFLPPAAGLVAEELREKRDLVLVGAVLLVGEQAANGRYRQLVANIVRLEQGARIVTNGARLEIMANQIRSDGGEIVAFEFVEAARQAAAAAPPRAAPPPPRPRRRGEPAAPEQPLDPLRPSTAAAELGTHGADGGLLRLIALTPLQGRLTVRLNGQDGALGEPGEAGQGGLGGRAAGDAIGDLLECQSGGGGGYLGGGQGGAGGAGGDAGEGGALELMGPLSGSADRITFQAEPGVPGRGGPGGPGGSGAAGFDACGVYIPAGPPGSPGGPGPTGQAGAAGRVVTTRDIE